MRSFDLGICNAIYCLGYETFFLSSQKPRSGLTLVVDVGFGRDLYFVFQRRNPFNPTNATVAETKRKKRAPSIAHIANKISPIQLPKSRSQLLGSRSNSKRIKRALMQFRNSWRLSIQIYFSNGSLEFDVDNKKLNQGPKENSRRVFFSDVFWSVQIFQTSKKNKTKRCR